ncbi:MAG TPA: response regulator [Planctomycetota bacterium]|jgi:CheY-like chemotaxis protein|nr:response regulator [Planctomycetota bacterium]
MSNPSSKSGQIRTILMAEDNPNDAELALEALGHHNLSNQVVVVEDGVHALDYLYRRGNYKDRPAGNPCVLLLDLKMPRIDGLEVLKTMKSDPQLKTIPVVILTSSREEQDLVKGYELGTNAYVVKPVNFADFVEAVKTLGLFWAVFNEQPPVSAGPK